MFIASIIKTKVLGAAIGTGVGISIGYMCRDRIKKTVYGQFRYIPEIFHTKRICLGAYHSDWQNVQYVSIISDEICDDMIENHNDHESMRMIPIKSRNDKVHKMLVDQYNKYRYKPYISILLENEIPITKEFIDYSLSIDPRTASFDIVPEQEITIEIVRKLFELHNYRVKDSYRYNWPFWLPHSWCDENITDRIADEIIGYETILFKPMNQEHEGKIQECEPKISFAGRVNITNSDKIVSRIKDRCPHNHRHHIKKNA